MGIRNQVSHLGQRDLDQPTAERALDTMALLCAEIDPESALDIRDLYNDIREQAMVTVQNVTEVVYTGAAQPASESKRGSLKEGSLLLLDDSSVIERTAQTRKVTFGGKTDVYPVYRIRLDKLFYNDQNDRIATWLSRYKTENPNKVLEDLDIEEYNAIIEEFIVNSNPEAILKTQKNIALVGQRESGVTLADGRIVDGNRRFTCLRRLQKESDQPLFFETVIMDVDIRDDKKQIKLLELSIQHGEEKKVDYDPIDYVIGTYRDVIQTGLLTIDEYAESTNEQKIEVQRRLDIAELIIEFLSYIKLSNQYHVAREYQVYGVFSEMRALLKQLDDAEQKTLKEIVFSNIMMGAVSDQRKFIRDIKGLVKSKTYKYYFDDQSKLIDRIQEQFTDAEVHSKEDIECFIDSNRALEYELASSMERALKKSRNKQLRSRPSTNVTKSISLLLDIDTRLFAKLKDDEKEDLRRELEQLDALVKDYKTLL